MAERSLYSNFTFPHPLARPLTRITKLSLEEAHDLLVYTDALMGPFKEPLLFAHAHRYYQIAEIAEVRPFVILFSEYEEIRKAEENAHSIENRLAGA